MDDPKNRVAEFEAVLARWPGKGKFPVAVVVDLDDLASTLEKGARLVFEVAERGESWDPEQLSRRLHVIEMFLTDELPPIVADVLPALRKIRRVKR